MSQENVELVRRSFDELGTPARVEQVEQRLSDEALAYAVESQEAVEAGDQVVVVFHVAGRTHDVEVDATWSSLCTVREGRIVRVQNFTTRGGALEAAGLGA